MTTDWHSVTAGREREARESAALRRARGIVHTPRELAVWALLRVQDVLAQDFGRSLVHPDVCVLDPAVGTGIWLEAALHASHPQPPLHARDCRWLGFDVDARALDTARALLTPACAARSVELTLGTANTLELASPWPAGEHVRVVVGNPPWAARSLSRGGALSDAWLADFQRDARGEPLRERRAGVLSDDYVRFFRWALEQLAEAPRGGVVCLATNGSFLDGPVHRGMRARLLEQCDAIDILDLGGNALLARATGRDDNLFGVRVGAALTLLVKRPAPRGQASVAYRRLTGSREHKLACLARGDLPPVTVHVPAAPLVRFVPAGNTAGQTQGFSLDEAFPFHREGVQTNRDALAIDRDRDTLLQRLEAIAAGEVALPELRHLAPDHARARLREALAHDAAKVVAPLAYRPLDTRFVCTVAPLCHRPRPELLAAVARSSFCLASVRKDRGEAPFALFAPLAHAADSCFLSARSSCRTRVFPSHGPEGDDNLAPRVRDELARRLGHAPPAADVLAYALGVLASATFRERAGEALKHDYARLPWPRSPEAFAASMAAGRRLHAALHGEVPRDLGLFVSGCRAAHIVDVLHTRAYPDEGRIELGGAGSIGSIPRGLFDVQLGHHALLESSLKWQQPKSIDALLEVVLRTAAWATAVATADSAFTRA